MARILLRANPSLYVLAAIIFLTFSPSTPFAADIKIQSETMLLGFERDVASGDGKQVSPVYQYLQLDSENFSIDGLSFHAYGWGRHDFSDNDFYDDQSDGELLYAYLDFNRDDSPLSARLGRQYVFSGVANDSIDGLWLKNDFNNYFSADVYAGQPVALSSTNGRSGDSIYGGRLAHKNRNLYEIGISYKLSQNDSDTAEETLGVDIAADLPFNGKLFGVSARNMETEGWAEHSYEINFQIDNVTIRPFYEYYSYSDYFDTGDQTTNPFTVLSQSSEDLSTFGVDATWRQSESYTFGGKVKFFSYDDNHSSNYVSVLASWNSDSTELTQVGTEIGYMAGDAANNDYLLLRFYGFKDEIADRYWLDFISGDVTYASYDEDIYGRSYSLFTSLGAGKKFLDDRMTARLSGDYSQDPYFDDNLQVFLSFSFAYDFSM